MRRLLPLLIWILLSPLSLMAGPLRLGLAVAGGDGLLEAASSCIDLVFSSIQPSVAFEEAQRAREDDAWRRTLDTEQHQALREERAPRSLEREPYIPYYETEAVYEIIPVTAQDDFIASADSSMIAYNMSSSALDAFFIFSVTDADGLDMFSISYSFDGVTEELYSALCLPGTYEDLLPEATAVLLGHFSDGLGLVDLSAFPPSCQVLDEEGNVLESAPGGLLVMEDGGHSLRVLADHYEPLDLSFTVSEGAVTVLEGGLEPLPVGTVTITATPVDATLSLFGVEMPSLPLSASFQGGAVLATISKEGFAPTTLQLDGGQDFVSVTLRPQWMADDGRVREAKDRMYRSMRNSLLSFGLYVAMSAIGNIYSDASPWTDAFGVLAGGVAVVNLVDFIYDCISYYDTAKQVYLQE